MLRSTAVVDEMRVAIERTGYYPVLVGDCMTAAIAGEEVTCFALHHEATFDRDELRRHVTVLALTPSRLLMGHVDEHSAAPDTPGPTTASAATEAIRLERIRSVVITRVVADPANYRPGQAPTEVMLNVSWGAVRRLDIEPASCPDPQCDADHGFTGSSVDDDLSIRCSEAADGPVAVQRLLQFAAELSRVTGQHS